MEDRYLRIHREELQGNNATVTPIAVVVDTSHSMVDSRFVDNEGRTRMERLNEGIREFIEEIKKDDILADSVEIAIITFNNSAEEFLPFSTIENIPEKINIPGSRFSGDTPKGVDMALDILNNEKQFLKNNKKKYNQPWIVIMSDGRATPGKEAIDPDTNRKDFTEINNRLAVVQKTTQDLEQRGKLTVIPVLISEETDGYYKLAKNQMLNFTVKKRCKEIGEGKSQVSFKDFFKILSRSVSVSNVDIIFSENESIEKHNDFVTGSMNDYIPQEAVESVVNIFQQTEKNKSNETNDYIPISKYRKEEEDVEEVYRLMQDSQLNSNSDEFENDEQDEKKSTDYEKMITESDKPKIEVKKTVTSVLNKHSNKDDEYLKSLLSSLDDWDNI